MGINAMMVNFILQINVGYDWRGKLIEEGLLEIVRVKVKMKINDVIQDDVIRWIQANHSFRLKRDVENWSFYPVKANWKSFDERRGDQSEND
jgi:hypothetical protein